MFLNTLRSNKKNTPPPPSKPYVYNSISPSIPKQPSLGRVMIEGVAFGTGSAIARETVNRTMNAIVVPSGSSHDQKKYECRLLEERLQQCFDERFYCNDLFEKYIRKCSRLRSTQ